MVMAMTTMMIIMMVIMMVIMMMILITMTRKKIEIKQNFAQRQTKKSK
jgi:energy-converting hydrogenase Eha subunit H